MICDSTSQIIPAIKSRCLMLRFSSPTKEDIIRNLKEIAQHERINPFNPQIYDQIANDSN